MRRPRAQENRRVRRFRRTRCMPRRIPDGVLSGGSRGPARPKRIAAEQRERQGNGFWRIDIGVFYGLAGEVRFALIGAAAWFEIPAL